MVRDGKMDLSFRLPAVLMQERDGSLGDKLQAEYLESVPMDRYSKTASGQSRAEPCPDKR